MGNDMYNLTTNIYLIKTFFISLATYYTFLKLTNHCDKSYIRNIIVFFSLFIISIIATIINTQINSQISIISLFVALSFIFSIKTKNNIGFSIMITVISLAFNYLMFFISLIITFFINKMINIESDIITLFFITIIDILFLNKFFKNRKLKYGIAFLTKGAENQYFDVLILNVSVIILFSIILFTNYQMILSMSLFLGIMIFASVMFITIQKSLQLYYKQKLLIKELDETKEELAKKMKEVEELETENLSFSKKSHTLAHKQKSLEYKLQEIINKTEISKEEVAEVTDRLKEIEKDLYKEKTTIELDKTGITQVDDMLKYMQSECKKNKIDFELQLNGNIHYMTNNLITKEDLETLLADHIKNAIIAINHTDNVNRSILVRLGKIDETYGLYIYDSGIEFEAETLENLGKKPSTTHAKEGGTGMGFMNTFDTLRKCNASLIIEEYSEPNKDNYTKVIMIKFDNKNEFKIKSYREKLAKIR